MITPKNHCVNPYLCLSIFSRQYPHRGLYERDNPYFDHLLTQSTLVGLRVKLSKCKLWSPLGFSLSIEILHGHSLVIDGLCILGVLVGFQNFVTYFLDKILSQDAVHINDLFLLGNTQVALGILFSCVVCQLSYLNQTI
jgi:hypothetical protein